MWRIEIQYNLLTPQNTVLQNLTVAQLVKKFTACDEYFAFVCHPPTHFLFALYPAPTRQTVMDNSHCYYEYFGLDIYPPRYHGTLPSCQKRPSVAYLINMHQLKGGFIVKRHINSYCELKRRGRTARRGRVVSILIRIREVSGSNLSLKIVSLGWYFSWFSSVPPDKKPG
jgi:hypothetical protein